MHTSIQTIAILFVAILPLSNGGISQASDAQSIASLFSALDENSDGQVTAIELNEAQLPYFRRALRVADRNEDGALTREELTTALTDPEPVQMQSTTPAGRRDFDISRLDRNGDGKLTRDEIPTPLKERFERLFSQFGDPVSVQAVQAMRRMQKAGSMGSAQQKASRAMKANPETEMSQDSPRRPAGSRRAAPGGSFFDRLDKNQDGKLTREELPPRMQQAAQRMDSDNNGSISSEEFERALRMRNQNRN